MRVPRGVSDMLFAMLMCVCLCTCAQKKKSDDEERIIALQTLLTNLQVRYVRAMRA